MRALIISDLHLDPGAPARTQAFLRLLRTDTVSADAFYVLGDLFEAWIGDDDDAPLAREVQTAISEVAARGTACYFMAGNRDFLVGERFAANTGMTILSDPTVHSLGGEDTLLMHGDTLCTGDTDYQIVRQQLHAPAWQAGFLAQPLAARREFARAARAESAAATAGKAEEIMDVAPDEVRRVMAAAGVRRLVHGHTHRPAVHELDQDGSAARRIVLGAWHDQGWRLWLDPDGSERLEAFPL